MIFGYVEDAFSFALVELSDLRSRRPNILARMEDFAIPDIKITESGVRFLFTPYPIIYSLDLQTTCLANMMLQKIPGDWNQI